MVGIFRVICFIGVCYCCFKIIWLLLVRVKMVMVGVWWIIFWVVWFFVGVSMFWILMLIKWLLKIGWCLVIFFLKFILIFLLYNCYVGCLGFLLVLNNYYFDCLFFLNWDLVVIFNGLLVKVNIFILWGGNVVLIFGGVVIFDCCLNYFFIYFFLLM